MQRAQRQNLLSIYGGPFCKLLNKTKAQRTSKAIRLVMFQYLKLAISLIKPINVLLEICGIPRFLNELLRIILPQRNLMDGGLRGVRGNVIQIKMLFFRRSSPSTFPKMRLRGRIKRKIRRKLMQKLNLEI